MAGNRCWIALGLGLAACAPAPEAEPIDRPITVAQVGFATPESVLHDPEADVYLVSNINGAPLAADNNGFISRVSPTGEVLALKWIEGGVAGVSLDAPKGMALVGDTLYLSDITRIRMFHRVSGQPLGELAVEGATFLNDVAAGPDGSVYFTDSGLQVGEEGLVPSGSAAVYRLRGGVVTALVRGDPLQVPNGLVLQGDNLWMVGFGGNELARVADGTREDIVSLPAGSLDGVEFTVDGGVLISSWEGQAVYYGPVGGPFTTVVSQVEAPADIGYDAARHRVLVPLFNANEVRILPLAP